jgi:hypothetical protein
MMKLKLSLLTSAIVSLAILAIAQSSPDIVGKWRGENRGTQWVTVNVNRDSGGQLSGTAVFYILDQTETAQMPIVLGKQEVALVDPVMARNVFSFKIKNQQGTVIMNPSSGDALAFKMIVQSDTEATLRSKGQESLSVHMIKQK